MAYHCEICGVAQVDHGTTCNQVTTAPRPVVAALSDLPAMPKWVQPMPAIEELQTRDDVLAEHDQGPAPLRNYEAMSLFVSLDAARQATREAERERDEWATTSVRTDRRADNADAQWKYMCDEIASAVGQPVGSPADTVGYVRDLVMMANDRDALRTNSMRLFEDNEDLAKQLAEAQGAMEASMRQADFLRGHLEQHAVVECHEADRAPYRVCEICDRETTDDGVFSHGFMCPLSPMQQVPPDVEKARGEYALPILARTLRDVADYFAGNTDGRVWSGRGTDPCTEAYRVLDHTEAASEAHLTKLMLPFTEAIECLRTERDTLTQQLGEARKHTDEQATIVNHLLRDKRALAEQLDARTAEEAALAGTGVTSPAPSAPPSRSDPETD